MSIQRRLQRMKRLARITARCSCAPGDGVDVEFTYRRDRHDGDEPTESPPPPRTCPRCRKARRMMNVVFVYERKPLSHVQRSSDSAQGRGNRAVVA